MSSSSKAGPFRNVPPPDGGRPVSAYSRFIPREELGEFSAWNPDLLCGGGGAAAAAPAAPTDAEWQTRITAARQAGYHDGYRDGLVALEEFKQNFAGQMSGQIGTLLESIEGQFLALEGQMAEALTTSALHLARQVVRSELSTRPELVARVAVDAVNAVLLSARHITLRVHPLDLPLVEQGGAEAIAARGAHLLSDDAVLRGGCQVDSDLGAVDARVATRWAQAAAALGGDLPWHDADAADDAPQVST